MVRQAIVHHGKLQYIMTRYNTSWQATVPQAMAHHDKLQYIMTTYSISRQTILYHDKR